MCSERYKFYRRREGREEGGGGVFKTKPITITKETFVISNPDQPSFPPKYNLASQVFIIDVCSSSFDIR
jgi:hypothetical protein